MTNQMVSKILFILVLIIYTALGYQAFIYLFGTAFFADDVVVFVFKIVMAGLVASFLLSFLASLKWPRQFYAWGIAYGMPTFLWGIVGIWNIPAEGPVALIFWSGLGIAMFLAGLGGGLLARFVKSKYSKG